MAIFIEGDDSGEINEKKDGHSQTNTQFQNGGGSMKMSKDKVVLSCGPMGTVVLAGFNHLKEQGWKPKQSEHIEER